MSLDRSRSPRSKYARTTALINDSNTTAAYCVLTNISDKTISVSIDLFDMNGVALFSSSSISVGP